MGDIDELWDALLSREPELILSAFNSLQPDEQILIVKHLSRMTNEKGWQPSQIKSAQTALEVLDKIAP